MNISRSIFILIVSLIAFSCEDEKETKSKDEEPLDDEKKIISIPCLTANDDCKQTILLNGSKNYTFDIYSTHPLDSVMMVKDAIIFVHGKDRNANQYFNTMVKAIENLKKTNDVIVIAPMFKNEEDVFNNTDIYWSYLGWRYGNNSQPSSSVNRHSSFSVIDTLINKLSNKNHFPKLNKVFIGGHSAGAQFAQLYSAGNSIDGNISSIEIGYWIANSQFFLYTNGNRWSDIISDFAVPDLSECEGYNEYPRGLEDRNTFMNKLSIEKIKENISSRNVTLLLGEEDITNSALTTTCYAMLLGKHRFDRGAKYFSFLSKYFSSHNYIKITIPTADHDKDKIYLSTEGLSFISKQLSN